MGGLLSRVTRFCGRRERGARARNGARESMPAARRSPESVGSDNRAGELEARDPTRPARRDRVRIASSTPGNRTRFMPDLSPQPPHPQADRTAGANGDGADPLAKLHRMSRTAGLGTQDYVAINVAAVVSALLGLASVLALVTSLLLVIPVAGVICGLVALYQIKDSNGT